MSDGKSADTNYSIKPTEHKLGKYYSDNTMTSLFNAQVAILNSERQTIWQRYSALLIANSVVISFLATKAPTSPIVVILGCLVGILLCCVWSILTADGWKFFEIYSVSAAQFSWPQIGDGANPIRLMLDEFESKRGDRIKHAALSVIYIFLIGYVLLAVWVIYEWQCNVGSSL